MFPVKDLFPSINQTYVLRGNTEASCIQGYTYLHMGAMGGGGRGGWGVMSLSKHFIPICFSQRRQQTGLALRPEETVTKLIFIETAKKNKLHNTCTMHML